MINFDYHSHHWRCGHAAGEMRDYIEVAIAQGMREFGVSDHNPAYFLEGEKPLPSTMMGLSELPVYVAEARVLQAEYAGKISVRVGIEADYVEGREEQLTALLAPHDFDYVLGSVHFALGKSIFDKKRWLVDDPKEVFTEYYRLVAKAAQSGIFDILSHLSAVEAYSPPMPERWQKLLYPPVVEAVAAGGCAVEVNTSGFRKMGGDDPFPNRVLLAMLVEAGVPITFGSDTHTPREVGYFTERVGLLLQQFGVKKDSAQLTTIRRRPIYTYRK